jgi:hypothetical protein
MNADESVVQIPRHELLGFGVVIVENLPEGVTEEDINYWNNNLEDLRAVLADIKRSPKPRSSGSGTNI